MTDSGSGKLEAVKAAVTVPLPPARAFELFTRGMGRWWPTGTHSVCSDPEADVRVEGEEGGRVYERAPDGTESEWGTVLVWDPPARFAMTWHPGRPPETAQRVDVRFLEEGGGTRVALEHTGWEAFGEGVEEVRDRYTGGWAMVLGELASAGMRAAAGSRAGPGAPVARDGGQSSSASTAGSRD